MKRLAAIFVALLAGTALAQTESPPPNGQSANGPPPSRTNSDQTRSSGRRQGGRPPSDVTTQPTPGAPSSGRPNRPGRPGGGGPPAVQPMPMPTPPVRPVPPVARPPVARPPFTPNPWHRPTASQWYWHGRWVNRIRGPAFVWPPGHPYVRRSIGQFLPRVFLQSRFWFDNVGPLGLPRAPFGFRWIRHGPDLLLVNMTTGRIVDVAWGVFFF